MSKLNGLRVLSEQIMEGGRSATAAKLFAFIQRETTLGKGTQLKDWSFQPDPRSSTTWLAMNKSKKVALIVYLDDNDFEEVDYDEAVKKYGSR